MMALAVLLLLGGAAAAAAVVVVGPRKLASTAVDAATGAASEAVQLVEGSLSEAEFAWAHTAGAKLKEVWPGLTPAARGLLLAHWAYESGFGKSKAAQANNLANLSAGSAWKGEVLPGGDTEYDAAGKVKSITQSWRAYASVGEFIRDYHAWMNRADYQAKGVPGLISLADLAGFAHALSQLRYYTLPETLYIVQLSAVRGRLASAGLA